MQSDAKLLESFNRKEPQKCTEIHQKCSQIKGMLCNLPGMPNILLISSQTSARALVRKCSGWLLSYIRVCCLTKSMRTFLISAILSAFEDIFNFFDPVPR